MKLHWEYGHRFKVEFQSLLAQQTFAAIVFRNSDLLFKGGEALHLHTLRHCLVSSFDGLGLGLSRIWDEDHIIRKDRSELNMISIPMLANHFENYHFLGCRGLRAGHDDRAKFDTLYADPMRTRLRVVRTEALAHSVMVGESKDRGKSDIKDKQKFDVRNDDILDYCGKTLDLLFSLNDQLEIANWRGKKTMDEMRGDWNDRHLAFLRHFEADVQ